MRFSSAASRPFALLCVRSSAGEASDRDMAREGVLVPFTDKDSRDLLLLAPEEVVDMKD